ncbi:zinc finger protein 235 [Biomphalaria glabrata]|nr:zinc finger protein 235 [Biomphalaria glabrata]
MMSEKDFDVSSLELKNILKHVKKEIEDPDLLAQPCGEQDFKMSEIKIEKIDEEEADLYTQQSENCAEASNLKLEHQETIIKQEIEMSNCTESNKPWSMASGLVAGSMKTNNSLDPEPVISPKFKTPSHTQSSEESASQLVVKKENEVSSEDNADNIQVKFKGNHSKETVLTKKIKTYKKHICQICLREFSQSSHLKSHQVTHTGEKPFKCQICLKGFSQNSSLYTHQVIHTGEKPFQCQICLKQFSRASNLKSHQRVHKGDKQFKCQNCQEGFPQYSLLKAHQLVHAGEIIKYIYI